ncbi:unnamed protein product, partial [Sphenostylis stenocarpa]
MGIQRWNNRRSHEEQEKNRERNYKMQKVVGYAVKGEFRPEIDRRGDLTAILKHKIHHMLLVDS